MSYLLQEDLKSLIKQNRLADLLDDVDTPEEIFAEAAEEAQGIVADHLDRYDMDAEYAKEGNARNRSVLYYCKNLCLYILYNRIPDDDVPERVIKNHDDTIDTLREISKGKMNINLPTGDTDGDGDDDLNKTKFRYGGNAPRKY